MIIFYLHHDYLVLYSLYCIFFHYNELVHYLSLDYILSHMPDKKGELWV